MLKLGIAPGRLRGVKLSTIHEELTLTSDVTPYQHNLMFLTACVGLDLALADSVGGREPELEGNTSLRCGDGLATALCAIVDHVRRVDCQVIFGCVGVSEGQLRLAGG